MPAASHRLLLFTLFTTLASSVGCYSMNGYMMNASGQGYYEKGNYALAAQEFQTALANNPTNPDYMANLAKARMKMGDATGAEQLYRQALTTSPAHQPSYHGYAELLLNQNRGEEAQRMLTSWAATQPYIAESHVELAWVQRELGQHDASARSLQNALQVNPNHSTALAHLGQYYQDAGHPDQAIALYQQSLESNWNQPEVQTRLASASSTSGPSHPMNRIAMERGVHPHTLPPQQLAARPAMGMPYQQFAQSPMPMQPSVVLNDVGPYGMLPSQNQPLPVTTVPVQPALPQSATGAHPMNHAVSMPTAATAPIQQFGPVPALAPNTSSVSNPAGPTPLPKPDPAFSVERPEVNAPVTSVSHSTQEDPPTAIEAF